MAGMQGSNQGLVKTKCVNFYKTLIMILSTQCLTTTTSTHAPHMFYMSQLVKQ